MNHSALKTNLRKCFTIQTITIPTLTRFACTVVFKASLIYSVSIERISNEIRMKYFLAKIRALKVVEMALMVLNNKLYLSTVNSVLDAKVVVVTLLFIIRKLLFY